MAYWVSSSVKTFDDSGYEMASLVSESGSMDTREIDQYRQGIELNTVDKFFKGTQPKIWVGNISNNGTVSHENDYKTYGQSISFSSFFGKAQFPDNLVDFDPVFYLEQNQTYPFPIILNDGPQEREEASIEPFTIPFRKIETEPVYAIARKIRGFLDGGQVDVYTGGTSLVSQFVYLDFFANQKKFYDFGEEAIGETLTGSVLTPGYIPNDRSLVKPTEDQLDHMFKIDELSITSQDEMYKAILELKSYRDDDGGILPFGKKSKSAGYDVYGPKQSRYGTDSIAFIGRLKGS